MNVKNKISRWAALFTFFIFLAETPAHADVQLDCCGIPDRWMQEANRLINQAETAVNEEVNHYVSLANFDLGSAKFGIQGNASLGQLKAPSFDCQHPKAALKSGMADFGLEPEYLISAKLFGQNLDIIDARLHGGQGKGTEQPNLPRVGKTDIMMSVKIVGIEVLHKRRNGVETEAPPVEPDPTPTAAVCPTLPAKMKSGTNAKLVDISRSISQTLGYVPGIPILPGVFIEFDAGFFLQSTLVFSYGIDSSIYSAHGSASVSAQDVTDALSRNPSEATDELCDAPPNSPPATNGCPAQVACTKKSSSPGKKAKEFYTQIKNDIKSEVDKVRSLKKQVQDVSVAKMWNDAKTTVKSVGSDIVQLTSGNMSLLDRCSLLGDVGTAIRPLQQDYQQVKAIYDTAESIISDAKAAYDKVQQIRSALKSGFPEVKADAGVAITGRAGGWAEAVLAIDLGIARGYAGIKGTLVLIDLSAGLGASLSTKSQYADLTVHLQQVLLAGAIDLIYGVQVGVPGYMVTYEDSINLFHFDGIFSDKHWLVGRLDFRALNANSPKSPLFWCVNLFGNTTIDVDRCTDGFLPKNQVIPALAAHQDFAKAFLGEVALDDTANCFISDGGTPFATLHSSTACSSYLPAPTATSLPAIPATAATTETPHPMAKYYSENAARFISNLRNNSNAPFKIFTANEAMSSGAALTTTVQYTSAAGAVIPILAGTANNLIQFENPAPSYAMDTDAPMSSRILSLNTRVQFTPQPNPTLTPTVIELRPTDRNVSANLMIDMDWLANGTIVTWPQGWPAAPSNPKIYVGEVIGLPNDILIDMAKNYRLGRCQVTDSNFDFTLALSGKPYPTGGDPEGKVSINMFSSGPCALGADAATMVGGTSIYTACMLREALKNDECFPPERAVQLVSLANLTRRDTIDYFMGNTSKGKKISGDVYPRNHYGRAFSPVLAQQVSTRQKNIWGEFFKDPWQLNSNSPGPDRINGDPDESTVAPRQTAVWLYDRIWCGSCGGNGEQRAYYLMTRATTAYYRVGDADADDKSDAIGTQPYPFSWNGQGAIPSNEDTSTAFSAQYNFGWSVRPNPWFTSTWYNGFLYDAANTAHYSQFASYQKPLLESLAQGDPDHGAGFDFANGIKLCVANSHCDYVPDGMADLSPSLASSCSMRVSDGVATFNVTSTSPSDSVEGCIQNTSSPNFKDARAFCNDSTASAGNGYSIRDFLKTFANASSTRTFELHAYWAARGQADASGVMAMIRQDRVVGTCAVHQGPDVNGRPASIDIIGQTIKPDRSIASTGEVGNGAKCNLSIRKSGTSSSGELIRSNGPDDVVDPTADDLSCLKSFNFTNDDPGTDSGVANEICSSLSSSPETLNKLFSADAATLASPANPASPVYTTASAQLLTTLSSTGVTKVKNCSITLSTDQWGKIFDNARCYVQLDPRSQQTVNGTSFPLADKITVTLPPPSGTATTGRDRCQARIQALFNSCTKIKSMEQYIPFSGNGGAHVTAFYGITPLTSPAPFNCSLAYTPASSGLGVNANCKVVGEVSNSSPSISGFTNPKSVLYRTTMTVNNASSCETAADAMINLPGSANQFCEENLPFVRDYLADQNNNGSLTGAGYMNDGLGFYKYQLTDANPLGTSTRYPLSVTFRSRYSNLPLPTALKTCHYGFDDTLKGFMGFSYHKWILTTDNGEDTTVTTCVRPNSDQTTGAAATGKPDCVKLPANHHILFGGAGPGFLEEKASAYSGADLTAACTTYLLKMNAVSEVSQADNTKRYPLYVVRADASGNLIDADRRSTMPKDTDPAVAYCQPAACTMDVQYQGESHPKELGFLQTFGRSQNSLASCVDAVAGAAESSCIEFSQNSALPDNATAEVVAMFGNQQQFIKTCQPSTFPKECSVGFARSVNDNPYLVLTKPQGSAFALSLTSHVGVFGEPNTKQSCIDYTAGDYCSMQSPFLQDANHAGESYDVYRSFGPDRDNIGTCYTALNLSANATAMASIDDSLQINQIQWNASTPQAGYYEVQYCRGANCDPSLASQPDHYFDSFTIASGATAMMGVRNISADAGVTYGYRIRLTIPALIPRPQVTLSWSQTVYATAQGTERNVVLSRGTPIDANKIIVNWADTRISDHYELQSCFGVGCTNFGPLPVPGSFTSTPPPPRSPIFAGILKTAAFTGISGGQIIRFRIRSYAMAASQPGAWSVPLQVEVTGGVINNATGGSNVLSMTGPSGVFAQACNAYNVTTGGAVGTSSLRTLTSKTAARTAVSSLALVSLPPVPSYALTGAGTGQFYIDGSCKNAVVSVPVAASGPTLFYFMEAAPQGPVSLVATQSVTGAVASLSVASIVRGGPSPGALIASCLANDLNACRAYVASFPVGAARDAAQASLKTLLVASGSSVCGLLGWGCASTSSGVARLTLISDQRSTKTPIFEVRGVPPGTLIKLMINADGTCSLGSVVQMQKSTSDPEAITSENISLLNSSAQFRVAAVMPDSSKVCSNPVSYRYDYLSGIVQVASGSSHSCSLSGSGEVKCWGSNSSGQLGNGTKKDSVTPVIVPDLQATALVAGASHTCALLSDGSIKCWGSNGDGQLGEGTTTSSRVPVAVPSLKAISMSAGGSHTCALLSSGGVKCWGSNYFGQLGINSKVSSLSPVLVPGLTASAISSGTYSTCALLATGSVECWGVNGTKKEYGYTSYVSSLVPVVVEGVIASAITSGQLHSCALVEGGAVKCWGDNQYSQLGVSSETVSSIAAVTVPDVTASSISAGDYHTCAVVSGGTVKCWGNNASGALGLDVFVPASLAVPVRNLDSVSALSAGGYHTCAVLSTGAVKCWGDNGKGLGDGTTTHFKSPMLVPDFVSTDFSAGWMYSCVLLKSGAVQCFGSNGDGQLGNGTKVASSIPVTVPNLSAKSIASGDGHTCALLVTGEVKCWGRNQYGQLGIGTNTSSTVPVLVPGISASSIYASAQSTCALLKSGAVSCWGSNFDGNLGIGTTQHSSAPAVIPGLTVKSLAMGYRHACAILTDGAVKCWGFGSYGELGNGKTLGSNSPVVVTGLTASSITAGANFTCAISTSGEIKCWGNGNFGALGDNNWGNINASPVTGPAISAIALSAGASHVCAILSSGGVKCWGYIEHGALGDGKTSTSAAPVDVLNVKPVRLTSYGHSTCAISGDGILKCWGENYFGQLQPGTDRLAPRVVLDH
ncbi:MAG: hypothetical protein H7222_15840 [Methylotenera sp.]|nr:hypothetical protein [Oligoflexia bacterium]